MNRNESSSVARILAGPLHQRLNQGGRWGVLLVMALCAMAPVGMFIWSLFLDPADAERLRHAAVRTCVVAAAWLLLAGWAMLVGNVQQQNHPTLARLVPGHVARLREALLAAWALLSLAAAAGPGLVFGAPLAWACAAAGALVLVVAVLRWPLLWLSGLFAPVLLGKPFDWSGRSALLAAWQAQWHQEAWLVTAIVVTAGAVLLARLVQSGDARHATMFESRRRLRNLATSAQQAAGLSPLTSRHGGHCAASIAKRPYAWWMGRLLAQRDSSVMARLLVGFGPATHWTTRVCQTFWFLVIGGGLCALIACIVGREIRGAILPWLSFSLLMGVCTPALQAMPRLHQSRREQALLVLLPGVPRGARLNRWLAWQMSLTFLVAVLCGFALAWALNAVADAIEPGVVDRATGGMTAAFATAMLPQVAWQWRRWAHLGGASGYDMAVPVLAPILLAIAALTLHSVTDIGYLAIGVALAAVSLLFCAWRWHRMADEPTALPVGRLAR
jgi:hypothetical protein